MSASMCQLAVVALMLTFPQLSDSSNLGRRAKNPDLDPESDKKFFGPPFPADYPSDTRGGGKHAFNYPFPHVQSSSTFDSDYVKDENSDNGEWNAQMEYDSLRAQLAKAKKEAEEAKNKEATEAAEADKAKDAYGDAKDAEKAAQAAADEAAAKAKEAADKEEAAKKAAEAGPAGDMPTDAIEAAKKKVEDKIKNLDDCKQQLKDAQDELKKLLEEAQKKRDEEAAEHSEEVKEAAGVVAKADSAADAAASEHAKAMQALEAASKLVDELKAKFEQEKAEENKAEEIYAKEQQDVAELEKKLKAAEDRLRTIRNGGSLPAHDDHRSDASASTLSLGVLALAALMVH